MPKILLVPAVLVACVSLACGAVAPSQDTAIPTPIVFPTVEPTQSPTPEATLTPPAPTRVAPVLIPTPGPTATPLATPTATPEGLSVPTVTLGGFPTPTPTTPPPSPTATTKPPPPTPTIVPITQLPAKLNVKWGILGSTIGRFDSPRDLSIDGQGNVYVLDFNNSLVQKFDASGAYITRWGGKGIISGSFTSPTALTVDATTNTVYVAEPSGRIQSFDSNGNYITLWGNVPIVDRVNLESPQALVTGAGSTLWIFDADDDGIQQVSSVGEFRTALTGCDGPGALSDVGAMAITPNGDIYVADSGNNRIHWLSSSGSSLAVWGSTGTGESQFNNPQGVAIDGDGNVYVSDTDNHRIQVFRSDGTFLGSWGAKGTLNAQFDQPMGIDIDSSGKIYVADSGNNRIQVFDKLDLSELAPAERVFIPGIETIDLFVDANTTIDTAFIVSSDGELAQSFRPRFDSISIIDVFIFNLGTVSKDLTINLRKGGADGPLILCQSQNTGLEQGDSGWFSFDIRNIRLTPGALYTIELSPALEADFLWGRTLTNDYTDGEASIKGEDQPFDWKFRTWGFT